MQLNLANKHEQNVTDSLVLIGIKKNVRVLCIATAPFL